jgi:hypothetical protein
MELPSFDNVLRRSPLFFILHRGLNVLHQDAKLSNMETHGIRR